jgi:hypothetical protein
VVDSRGPSVDDARDMGEPAVDHTPAAQGVPEAVLGFARSKRSGEKIVSAWQLHAAGGLSATECASRVGAHPDTVRTWFREIRAILGVTQEGDTGAAPQAVPVNQAILNSSDVAQRRADLLHLAETSGKLDLQARILDSEARRLGMDTTRVEQTSLVMTISMMPPEERRAELLQRVRRMALRGHLRPGDLAIEGAATGEDEGVGEPPRPGSGSPLLGPANISAPSESTGRTQGGTEDGHQGD